MKKNGKREIWICVGVAGVVLLVLPFLFILKNDGEQLPVDSANSVDSVNTHPSGVDRSGNDDPVHSIIEAPSASEDASSAPRFDTGGGQKEESQTQEPVTEEKPISDVPSDMASILDELCEDYNCVSASLAFFKKNELYLYQYGYEDYATQVKVSKETKYRVASISKLVTAICVMILADENKIDIDQDISEYLGYACVNPYHPDERITCRMLMQHTSSIYDSSDFLISRNEHSSISTQRLIEEGASFHSYAPGTQYEYSNFGVAVLGSVCEMVTGEKFDDFAHRVLFAPLEIDAAYLPKNLIDSSRIAVIYDANHNLTRTVENQLAEIANPALGWDQHLVQGNLTISPNDYMKIILLLMNDGKYNGESILSAKAVMEIHNPTFSHYGFRQGFCVQYQDNVIDSEEVFCHTGGNYGMLSQFVYSLENDMGIVMMTSGAKQIREENDMIALCCKMARELWEKAS